MPLLSRQMIPSKSLDIVLQNTLAIFVLSAQIELRRRISLLGLLFECLNVMGLRMNTHCCNHRDRNEERSQSGLHSASQEKQWRQLNWRKDE